MMAAGMLAACASMGRPEGGERDYDPPVYQRSNPMPGAVNFKSNHISVYFDENIQVEDAMNKVVVSPAQNTTPVIRGNGHRVTVELRDTLIPNTTYTIDFADAIKDLNEGNVLDGLAIDFSTGPEIDSLRISGMVFQAENLEPAQGMLVGAYNAERFSDTTLTKLPFERIAKTNQLGQFTLRNLKPGTYRVFAVDDVNRDYRWDRSENIAVYPEPVTPTAHQITVSDTLKNSEGNDSIVFRQTTEFLPDNLLLTWFNEGYRAQYLSDYSRPEPNIIAIRMSAKADSLPLMRLVNTHRAGDDISLWSRLEASESLDSLRYWITDSSLILSDTLFISTTYLRTDTLNRLVERTDTLRFLTKGAKKAKKENQDKKGKNKDKDAEADTVPPPIPALDFRFAGGQQQDLNKGLAFKSGAPIERFDTTAVKMEMFYEYDSIWIAAKPPRIIQTSPLNPLDFSSDYDWEEGTKYRLTIDSAAIADIYGHVNKPFKQEITTKKLGDYSSVLFNISGIPAGDRAVVELLSTSDLPVARAAVSNGSALLEYLAPATYYARLFIDRDSDGIWSTGNVADSIQPEDVYYFSKKLVLKKNWDIEQNWNINELAVDQQKPQEIKKNKPKKKRTREDDMKDANRNEDSQYEDEYDEFFDDPFMNSRRQGGSSSRNRPGNGRLRDNGGDNRLAR
ncbi:MAG: Ig-like domain-containing protein [Duncaniella sp.]|nr:Ig-like domain-containing protein [Duncaniella sp.]